MSTEMNLVGGVLFGAFGLGYFAYGKRQRQAIPLACGVGLMALPYFVDSAPWLLVDGSVLLLLPWFVRI